MDVRPSPRRHGRSVVAALALGATAVLALAGCSSPGGSGGTEEQTLTVWFPGTNPDEQKLVNDTLVPRFEEETGAQVEVTFVDWGDISTKLNSAFAAGTAPDVFGHGPAAAADFVANDRILNLDDDVASLTDGDREDLAAALPGGQVDGSQYLIPLSLQGYLVMYDAEAFAAAGLNPDDPPSTVPPASAVARSSRSAASSSAT